MIENGWKQCVLLLAQIFEKWVCLFPISFTIYWLDIKAQSDLKMIKLMQPGP